MKPNTVLNIPFEHNQLCSNYGNIILADPPYYKTKGEFDWKWKTFDAYLLDVELWAIQCARLLKDNGTLFWYGPSKTIAYSQIILDKHFNLINNLVWNKGSFMGLEESNQLKSFAPCTERILMYGSKAHDKTGLKSIEKEYVAPLNPFAIELRRARSQKGVSVNEVAEHGKFYKNVNHGGSVTNWEKGYNIPNDRQWQTLCEFLPIALTNYKPLKKEYDQIKERFQHLRRPFKNVFNLQEILNFSNEAVQTGSKHDHETVKPETLTRALIKTCSSPGDICIVPFAGSGTEVGMAVREGLTAYGFDVSKRWTDDSNRRIQRELNNPTLF